MIGSWGTRVWFRVAYVVNGRPCCFVLDGDCAACCVVQQLEILFGHWPLLYDFWLCEREVITLFCWLSFVDQHIYWEHETAILSNIPVGWQTLTGTIGSSISLNTIGFIWRRIAIRGCFGFRFFGSIAGGAVFAWPPNGMATDWPLYIKGEATSCRLRWFNVTNAPKGDLLPLESKHLCSASYWCWKHIFSVFMNICELPCLETAHLVILFCNSITTSPCH